MSTRVEAAISSILHDKDFDLEKPRMKIARLTAQKMLDMISGKNKDVFTSFAVSLNEKLEVLATPTCCKQLSTQKQDLWTGFHSARVSEIRPLWNKVYNDLGLVESGQGTQDPLLGEYVNEKLFEEHVKEKFPIETTAAEPSEPSEDDHNALRYAAGYIPWKLTQKYKKTKCKHVHRRAFLVCLERMSVSLEQEDNQEDDTSYQEYTTRWIRAIDRGGLFHVNDEVYVLFYEIEKKVRQYLIKLALVHELDKDRVIKEIVTDNEIEFFWSMISVDIDHHIGEQLLTQIVQLWLTIRGFSTAAAFVEQYKQITKTCTKKSSSLRKGLKKKNC